MSGEQDFNTNDTLQLVKYTFVSRETTLFVQVEKYGCNDWFYKAIDVYAIVHEGGEGITTFGQHVKKAWKNINEIKPKKNKK
jgi:hypothetical protein